jgi:serpin B
MRNVELRHGVSRKLCEQSSRGWWGALSLVSCLSACAPAEPEVAQSMQADEAHVRLVDALNTFAIDLYRTRASQAGPTENLFLAPVSVYGALAFSHAMHAGGQPRYAEGVKRLLRFAGSDEEFHRQMAELLQEWSTLTGDYTLNVVNQLYRSTTSPVSPSFSSTLQSMYGVEDPEAFVAPLDFAGDPEGSRAAINRLVSEKTNQKIPQLIPSGGVSSATQSAAASAAYFFSEWKEPFDESHTKLEAFPRYDGARIQAWIMKGQKRIRSASRGECSAHVGKLGWELSQIPYRGDFVAMEVLQPGMGHSRNFIKMEQALQANVVQELHDNLMSHDVKVGSVTLPRFRLAPASESLGAMFERMGFAEYGQSHDAWHQTFIDVNEKYTEAAGGTYVVTRGGSVNGTQPFVFMIRDLRTNAILFIGRIVDPSTAQ